MPAHRGDGDAELELHPEELRNHRDASYTIDRSVMTVLTEAFRPHGSALQRHDGSGYSCLCLHHSATPPLHVATPRGRSGTVGGSGGQRRPPPHQRRARSHDTGLVRYHVECQSSSPDLRPFTGCTEDSQYDPSQGRPASAEPASPRSPRSSDIRQRAQTWRKTRVKSWCEIRHPTLPHRASQATFRGVLL